MTGASVNFKAVKSAGHAVSHASREVAPTYLLANDKSMGTVVLLDDKGRVSQVLDAKMALASPRAKVDQRYSPVWEGILNLRRPEAGEDPEVYRAECSGVVTDWYKQYEVATGHKVLRVDMHLDEGHMVDGEAVLNAHAHVIADRTNDLGRVIKLSPKQLRELQTMTAEITQLERGKSSFETGRKHISHQAYKYLAELGRLETQQKVGKVKVQLDKSQSDLERQRKLSMEWSNADLAKVRVLEAKLDGEPARLAAALKEQEAQLNEKYRLDREAMKAGGAAKQADYQALKKAHEAALAKAQTEAGKMSRLEAQIDQLTRQAAKVPDLMKQAAKATQEASELRQLNDQYARDHEALKASGEAQQADSQALKVKHEAALADLTTAQTQAAKTTVAARQLSEKLVASEAKIEKLTAENVKLAADVTRFSEMAKAYQEEKPKGHDPALFVPGKSPAPLSSPSNKTREAVDPAPGPSLAEWIKESLAGMVEWVKSIGAEQEPVTKSSQHIGPVKHMDDLHCVQKTGRRYAIHQLANLDNIPALDDPNMTIRYKDGKGTVEGKLGKSGVQI